MKSRLPQTPTLKQHELLQRSAALRSELAAQGRGLRAPLMLADRLREAWRWLARHPAVPAVAVVALAVLRPRRAWRWTQRLWWGWRVWRQWQQPTR